MVRLDNHLTLPISNAGLRRTWKGGLDTRIRAIDQFTDVGPDGIVGRILRRTEFGEIVGHEVDLVLPAWVGSHSARES